MSSPFDRHHRGQIPASQWVSEGTDNAEGFMPEDQKWEGMNDGSIHFDPCILTDFAVLLPDDDTIDRDATRFQ